MHAWSLGGHSPGGEPFRHPFGGWLALLLCVGLTACEAHASFESRPATDTAQFVRVIDDTARGVACYAQNNALRNVRTDVLSCVRVRP